MNQIAQKLMTQHTKDCFFRDLNKVDLPRMTTSFLFQYWSTYYNDNLKSFEGQTIEYPIISSTVKNYVSKDYQHVLASSETSNQDGLIDVIIAILLKFTFFLSGSNCTFNFRMAIALSRKRNVN